MNLSLISVNAPVVNPNRGTMSGQEIRKRRKRRRGRRNISCGTGRNEDVADKKRGEVTARGGISNRFGSLESLRDVVPKLILGTRRHRPRKSCVLRTPLHREPLLRTPFPPLRWRNDEPPCEGTRERRRRGSVAGSHPGATSEGKNTHVEVRCSREWRRSSAVDADGGKVGKKCCESGLDR